MAAPPIVALARCSAYTADLRPDVQALLAHLGGMQAFVKPGQSVLIKPNLLTARTPDQAVTTHPAVIRSLICMVRDCGGHPSVGDSPANVMKMEAVWEQTGLRSLCREEDVPLLNLDQAGSQPFELAGTTVSIARPVLDTDVLISVPKVKTHVLTTFTCAVKNLYGTIPGFQKAMLHKRFARPGPFSRLLTELHALLRPALAVADGVVGMEGDGPSGGTPVPLGLLAASADSAALDTVLCDLLGIRLREVPYLDGGTLPRDAIQTRGTAPRDLRPAHFKVPSTFRLRFIPGRLLALLHPLLWIRPEFNAQCISCGRCVNACPATALALEPGARPVLNPPRCIGCCCCHEVCPAHAVDMTQSPLLSFVRRGRI